jgi:hypothetical protein
VRQEQSYSPVVVSPCDTENTLASASMVKSRTEGFALMVILAVKQIEDVRLHTSTKLSFDENVDAILELVTPAAAHSYTLKEIEQFESKVITLIGETLINRKKTDRAAHNSMQAGLIPSNIMSASELVMAYAN